MDIGDPFRYDDTWSPAAVASSSAEVHVREKSFLELTEQQPRCERLWESQAICQLSDDLGQVASKHQRLDWYLEKEQITSGKQKQKDEAQRRTFILQVAQPGLAALIDRSASRFLATSERLSHKEFLW
jgi:hypothetical protein